MEFLYFLGIGIIVAIAYIMHKIAKAFEEIVFAKGYGTELHAYYMCLFLGIVGYLYVIALPNAKLDKITIKHQKRSIELLEIIASKSDEPEILNEDDEEIE